MSFSSGRRKENDFRSLLFRNEWIRSALQTGNRWFIADDVPRERVSVNERPR